MNNTVVHDSVPGTYVSFCEACDAFLATPKSLGSEAHMNGWFDKHPLCLSAPRKGGTKPKPKS